MTETLLARLIESYHDVANELSDLLATYDGGNGLPDPIDKRVSKIRDSMDALYTETIR